MSDIRSNPRSRPFLVLRPVVGGCVDAGRVSERVSGARKNKKDGCAMLVVLQWRRCDQNAHLFFFLFLGELFKVVGRRSLLEVFFTSS